MSILNTRSTDWSTSQVEHELQLNDWITSAAFSKSGSVYVQTAHNVVVEVDLSFQTVSDVYECTENSILYSGAMLCLNDRVLVAAGTVLGGVNVWELESQKVLHQMVGHEGSIFGVCFSPDGKYLASCSDDRSIRIWDMKSSEELAAGWGHYARIWQLICRAPNEVEDGLLQVVSVSEDCTVRTWKFDGRELLCTEILEGHQGRNAWCGALNIEDKVVATGGGDGKIRLWDLDLKRRIDTTRQTWLVEDLPGFTKGETFKDYVKLDRILVAATSKGRLTYYDEHTKQWQQVADITLDSYSVVRKFEKSMIVAVVDRNGQLIFANFGDGNLTMEIHQLDIKGKISDVLTFSANDEFFVLCQTKNPSDPYILVSTNGRKLELTPPANFNITSTYYDTQSSRLYVGSRRGALAVYNFLTDTNYVECWRNVMSEDAITSIAQRYSGVFLLTSRAGYFSTVQVDSLQILGVTKLLKGSIEGSFITGSGEVVLYGFRNDLFFIWSETQESELLVEKCGGPHRTWQLEYSVETNDHKIFTFIYTRVSQVHCIEASINRKFDQYLLQKGFHGREIRTVAIRPESNQSHSVVATGSEDTTVRFSLVDSEGRVRSSTSQRKHVSGIQAGHWTCDGEHFISSAGREELIVWKVFSAETEVWARPVLELPVSSDLPDLRIMDFDTFPLGGSKYLLATVYSDSTIKIWSMDVEAEQFQLVAGTRYRECCLLNCDFIIENGSAYIVISSTDGHLVVWNIEGADGFVNSETSSSPATLQKWIMREPIHQSSVKASYIFKTDGRYLHVSAGDDNALCLAELELIPGSETFRVLDTVRDAHSCTITDLSPIPSTSQFITVSSDQNVRRWHITTAGKIELQETIYTTITDTGCVDVSELPGEAGARVFIGGSGLSSLIV